MDDRKKKILNIVIEEHIQTGAPVGSGVLVQKYDLNVSPATVRNEMAYLENEGYIAQPHTSAGRVPTEAAYRMYLDELESQGMESYNTERLDEVFDVNDESTFKEVAKIISDITGCSVFWAFHKNNLYYTGISNMFAQPEFSQLNIIQDISAIIDRIDEIIDDIFESIPNDISVLVGSENPFGAFCSSVIAKYKLGERTGVFGLLGPMRMDYKKNIFLVNYINNKIKN